MGTNDQNGQIGTVIADAQPLARLGLSKLLFQDGSFKVLCETDRGECVLDCSLKLQPHLVTLETTLADGSGLKIVKGVKDASPATKVVFITDRNDAEDMQSAIDAGADGFILKDAWGDELVQALKTAVQPEQTVAPQELHKSFSKSVCYLAGARLASPPQRKTENLTYQELLIVSNIVKGLSNKEIAARLKVSPETVKSHLKSILRKIGAKNRTHLAILAIKQDLVDLSSEVEHPQTSPDKD